MRDTGKLSVEFILLVALLNAMVAMSIDTMLPSMGIMAKELGAKNLNDEQLIILTFFLGNMVGIPVFGPVSDSVGRIQAISVSESESLGALANEILKDVALTNKLLRIVNTAHYRTAGGGTISTVSRAISLIGFAGIRNLALSLMLVERMEDKQHAQQLKEEFMRALMAGMLAGVGVLTGLLPSPWAATASALPPSVPSASTAALVSAAASV